MRSSSKPDADTFSAYVRSHGPRLLRSAALLTGDTAAAEDLLQGVLERVWSRWSEIERGGDPTAYVYRAIVNAHRSRWRRGRHEVFVAQVPDLSGPTDPVRESDDKQLIVSLLARLHDRQRAVVVLRYYADLSVEDTARILKCSVGTVKSQASDALQRLRAIIDDPRNEMSPRR